MWNPSFTILWSRAKNPTLAPLRQGGRGVFEVTASAKSRMKPTR